MSENVQENILGGVLIQPAAPEKITAPQIVSWELFSIFQKGYIEKCGQVLLRYIYLERVFFR